MDAVPFPLLHASSPLPSPSPPNSSTIAPLPSSPVVLFSTLAILLQIAAAVKRVSPYLGVSSRFGLVVWRSPGIRLRLDPLRRIAASYPDYPDPPPVRGLDPPGLSKPAYTLASLLGLLDWSEPSFVLSFKSQPESMFSGEMLDPSQTDPCRSGEQAVRLRRATLQRRAIRPSRTIQLSRSRGIRTESVKSKPDRIEPSRPEGSQAEPQAKFQQAGFQQFLVDEGSENLRGTSNKKKRGAEKELQEEDQEVQFFEPLEQA